METIKLIKAFLSKNRHIRKIYLLITFFPIFFAYNQLSFSNDSEHSLSKNLHLKDRIVKLSSSSLKDSQWELDEWKKANNQTVNLSLLDNPITLEFSEKEKQTIASGYSGCNRYFTQYQIEKKQIKFANIGLTRRACEQMQMEIEYQYIENLQNIKQVSLKKRAHLWQLIIETDNHEILYFNKIK